MSTNYPAVPVRNKDACTADKKGNLITDGEDWSAIGGQTRNPHYLANTPANISVRSMEELIAFNDETLASRLHKSI